MMEAILGRSEAVGVLVASRVEVDGKTITVHHFNLPPDETGIFNVAMRLATEPAVEETASGERSLPGEPMPDIEPAGEPVYAKEDLARAAGVAERLNGKTGLKWQAPQSEYVFILGANE